MLICLDASVEEVAVTTGDHYPCLRHKPTEQLIRTRLESSQVTVR